MRVRAQEGLNSLAWLIWHMARGEDMGVNMIVAGRPQVLEEEDWPQRLNISHHDVATGMTDDEVSDFSDTVDITALRDYRAAVGRRTREIVGGLRPAALDEVIDPSHVQRAISQGTIGENAGWLEGYVAGKTKAFLLGQVVTGHNFMHLGEAWCLRSLAGQRLSL